MVLLEILLPLLALSSGCHGAAIPEAENLGLETIMDTFQDFLINPSPYMDAIGVRAKRHTESEDHTGFKTFSLPFTGIEAGIKYKDDSNHLKGGEAFLHIKDLKSLCPQAHSNEVKLHTEFDGGATTTDGLFTAKVDYHLTHSDGDGTEEGSLEIVRGKRSGMWHTTIKTEAHHFTGIPIIPSDISNMQLDIESDRQKTLSVKYFNAPKGRDLKLDIVRVPEKSIEIKVTDHGKTHNIKGILSKPHKGTYEIKIVGTVRDKAVDGTVTIKRQSNGNMKADISVKLGAETIIHSTIMYMNDKNTHKIKVDYTIKGTKGSLRAQFKNSGVTIDITPYKIEASIKGHVYEFKIAKGDTVMVSYKLERISLVNNDLEFSYEAKSDLVLNTNSETYKYIQTHYKFGAWQTRHNRVKVTYKKKDRNPVLGKFKVEFELSKDGQKVFDLDADTTVTPYIFKLHAPNLLKSLGSQQNSLTVTVKHIRGRELKIESNIMGGLKLAYDHKPNSKGGRIIDIITEKGGVQMLKYHVETYKENTPAFLKFGLSGKLDLNPESLLYKSVVGKYKILTAFKERTSKVDFFWDKVNKNAMLNKFFVKAKVDKDHTNVLYLLISFTDEKPYKFIVFCPAIFSKLRPGMQLVDVTVDHVLGDHLFVNVNHPDAKWKGFKIRKTGPNEREIEWNGKKLGVGSYELTDKKFKTTQTLADGKSLTTTITWKNNIDTPNFFLDNKIIVNLDGTERSLDLNMLWKMTKLPDMDFKTPEHGTFQLNAKGRNSRWGIYTVNRDLVLDSKNKVITVDWHGSAHFAKGPLAEKSPINTNIKFSYDIEANDLEGKFMKNFKGKEYSITFPRGSMVMPIIKA